jgi:hypothetical protein
MQLVSGPVPARTFRCAAAAAGTAILLGKLNESASRAGLRVSFAGKRSQALGKDCVDARALLDCSYARALQHLIVDRDRQIRHGTDIV